MHRLKTLRNKVTDYLGYLFCKMGCWFYEVHIDEYFTYDELKELYSKTGGFAQWDNKEYLPVKISRFHSRPVNISTKRLKTIFKNIKTNHHEFGKGKTDR